MRAIDIIAGLFSGEGARGYLGEEMSVAVHMRQAAALAEAAGAPEAQVAAALLHDVGHICEGTVSGRRLRPAPATGTRRRARRGWPSGSRRT